MRLGLIGGGAILATAILALTAGGAAADALDVSKISVANAKIKDGIAKSFEKSGASSAFTVAVSADGKKYYANWSSSIPSDDRVRISLQQCEHVTKSPCILAVVDGKLTDSTSPHASVMTYPTEFTVSAVPFIPESTRNQLNHYRYQTPHQAVALRGDGSWAYVSQKDTADDASAAALANCSNGGQRKCFLYAVDDKILFNKDTDIFPK